MNEYTAAVNHLHTFLVLIRKFYDNENQKDIAPGLDQAVQVLTKQPQYAPVRTKLS